MRRNGNRNADFRLSREGGSRVYLVMHVVSLEKHVAVRHHLVTEYSVIGNDEPAVSLGVRQFAGKMVDVKGRSWTFAKNVTRSGRGAVAEERRMTEKGVAELGRGIASGRNDRSAR